MTRRSTLFHVDGERGLRGGERQLLYLAAALRARGRRNVVYCRAGQELEDEARRLGFEVRALPFLGEGDLFSGVKLAADARRENAVVHAHAAHAAGACAFASLAGVPFVAHRRVDFPVGALARMLKYGLAARTIAVSEAIARILRECGLPKDRIAVVPDGLPVDAEESAWCRVDSDRYKPPTAEQRKEYRRILAAELRIDPAAAWVGNLAALVAHKDHDTLLAAALIVVLKRPGTLFIVAGRGPEEARLKQRARRAGLASKVLFVGHRPDPIPLLKALDVYVQSSWGEGMGSVLIEAAACGVPRAATTAGGIPEVVADGETGLLVLPRRPEALAEALIKLLDDGALARRLAAAGLKRLPRFGLKRMASDMEKIYDAVD